MEKKGLPSVISKSYRRSLLYKCSLIFVAGSLLSSLIFYLFNLQAYGSSYQESFKLLSNLQQELLTKSLLLYSITTFLMIIGIAVITLLYSHRIVGPLYRLSMFVKKISEGDLSETVVLRGTDEVQLLADQFNHLIISYRKMIHDLSIKHGELNKLVSTNKEGNEDSQENLLAVLTAKVKELEGVVEKIKL